MERKPLSSLRRMAIAKAVTECGRCHGTAVRVPGGSYCNDCGLVADHQSGGGSRARSEQAVL